MLGTGVDVGRGMGVSEGVAVASGCEVGNPQAEITKRNKGKNKSLVASFEERMAKSFFEKSICQLYKQAAHNGRLVM